MRAHHDVAQAGPPGPLALVGAEKAPLAACLTRPWRIGGRMGGGSSTLGRRAGASVEDRPSQRR
jgi:hypothetical protein